MESLENLIVRGEESPFYHLLDIKIEEVKDGFARLLMNADTKYTQLYGMVHAAFWRPRMHLMNFVCINNKTTTTVFCEVRL
jgi:hypothetical protein